MKLKIARIFRLALDSERPFIHYLCPLSIVSHSVTYSFLEIGHGRPVADYVYATVHVYVTVHVCATVHVYTTVHVYVSVHVHVIECVCNCAYV